MKILILTNITCFAIGFIAGYYSGKYKTHKKYGKRKNNLLT